MSIRNDKRKGSEAREAIVHEATILFGRHGFDGVSLRDIAKSCGIPLSTLSHHFPLKQALEEVVMGRAVDVFLERMMGTASGSSNVHQRLEHYISNSVNLMLSDIAETRLVDREFQSLDQAGIVEMMVATLRERRANLSITRLLEETGSDLLKEIPAARLGDILYSLSYGLTKLRGIHAYSTDPANLTQEGIARDITLIFERALNFAEKPPDRAPNTDYFSALGEFVDEFANMEEIVRTLLRVSAGIDHDRANILFAGMRGSAACACIKQLRENSGRPVTAALERIFTQIGVVSDVWHKALDSAPSFDTPEDFLPALRSPASRDRSRRSVSAEALRSVLQDIKTISSGLLATLAEELNVPDKTK